MRQNIWETPVSSGKFYDEVEESDERGNTRDDVYVSGDTPGVHPQT